MIALLALTLQTAVPAAPPLETLPIAAAGLATRVTFDTAGAITGCTTAVRGLAGPIDGCLLFAKPALLARLLGRPTAGLAWVAVRLDGDPEGAVTPQRGADYRLLAEARVAIGTDGAVARCTVTRIPAAEVTIDLCALMPKHGAFFTPPPGGVVPPTLIVRFAIESGAR